MMRRVKDLLNTYNAINAYKNAVHGLSGEALLKWYSANASITKFMEYVWSLEENAPSS